MGEVTTLQRESVVERAKAEVQEELDDKAVGQLKAKYRELNEAQTVVANIEREIEDLEVAVEQGNF